MDYYVFGRKVRFTIAFFRLKLKFVPFTHSIEQICQFIRHLKGDVFVLEGMRKLFSGATMASARGTLVSVGQVKAYSAQSQIANSYRSSEIENGLNEHI